LLKFPWVTTLYDIVFKAGEGSPVQKNAKPFILRFVGYTIPPSLFHTPVVYESLRDAEQAMGSGVCSCMTKIPAWWT
jgi:NADH:ubiquinone oxidoreductase subunit F (NADH-binding)